ncbi:MAG TPA: 5'-nucleotidase C-terminal domain-containing protein [Anaerolineales bacterium]|nr:5'-nucleotidase C-terminal domain-containing protein [Anaerolineales bacterium]
MNIKIFSRPMTVLVTLALLFSLFSTTAGAAPNLVPSSPVSFTILHTNDFHGQLEPASGIPGSARVANFVNSVRTSMGEANVLLVDAGDQMQGSLLSNMGDGTPKSKGKATIATYNAMGYNVATFGNHEFDWGQENLTNRTSEALFPYITANIVKNDTGNCGTAGWTKPDFADAPYQILSVGSPNSVKVAFIAVTTTETPIITISTATADLCFKDPAESVIHYYDEMKAAGADVIVVLSHLGWTDSGGGYGLPVYGDQSLANKLNSASKPVSLIIGGHSHTDIGASSSFPVLTIGTTKIVQAANNGLRVGRADITVGTDGNVTVNWTRNEIKTTDPQDPMINSLISGPWDPNTNTGGFANNPTYLSQVNAPVGYSAVDLPRLGRVVDNMMSTFIDDAIYNYLNTDDEPSNDVDLFINNGGGIRTDWCWNGSDWVTTSSICVPGLHAPGLLTYGDMFTVLPFGNATIVGKMTGAQILEVLNHGPEIPYIAQPAGLKYKYFKYTDTLPPGNSTNPYLWAWGAFDVTVYNKDSGVYEPLDLNRVYSVGTNEFLAPGGGDGYNAFKYMTEVMSWGDMLNAVNAYVAEHYGTADTAYKGPNGDGTLDGRILRDNSIIPLTILHHNDSHGNIDKTSFVGYTQLATLIKQERQHNPRTLLLSSGDNIQGDAMSYYFKTAPTGFTSDGTAIADSSMHIQPLIKAFNAMGYDAMTLGNHEFNFGKDVFVSVLEQATFPLLQANVAEDEANPYGLAAANIQPYVEKSFGDIDVAILGIGNHRIPNYELPSNIPGLTFSDPIAKTQELSDLLSPTNDVVIALTHIGFTENPSSVEVDANVDTNLVAQTSGVDAVIGGHSHTNPISGFGVYKYLPTLIQAADGQPVIVHHAYRYNNTLGEVILGLRDLGGGKYEVVSRSGRYLSVPIATPEDAEIDAIVTPYSNMLAEYNGRPIGYTETPVDTTNAYIAETSAANLQADAAIYELSSHDITDVDFHLSGAMTRPSSQSNWIMFPGASVTTPTQMKISDMFTLMPYENSLVVLQMNGPQLKAVLERAYRNYYYYKYVPGYGGYSYYTTCMINTDAGTQITYNDLGAGKLPTGNNVVSLIFDDHEVDFTDAETYYNVSTVNYLAAGSCNFNDGGVSLWPLSQIVHDTQYYVRDAVINYAMHEETIAPVVEGRLKFITDTTPPVITINAPLGEAYLNTAPISFAATDEPAGVRSINGTMNGAAVNGQVVNLYQYPVGINYTLYVTAVDKAYNTAHASINFTLKTDIPSMMTVVTNLYNDGKISSVDVYKGLMDKLQAAANSKTRSATINQLNAVLKLVKAQSGKTITKDTATLLTTDIQWLIKNP